MPQENSKVSEFQYAVNPYCFMITIIMHLKSYLYNLIRHMNLIVIVSLFLFEMKI